MIVSRALVVCLCCVAAGACGSSNSPATPSPASTGPKLTAPIYKLIGDAGPGGTNVPDWADNGFVDLSLYVPAIDPGKP